MCLKIGRNDMAERNQRCCSSTCVLNDSHWIGDRKSKHRQKLFWSERKGGIFVQMTRKVYDKMKKEFRLQGI
jgi:hypothetical protein